jgi:hypothetical protein
MMPLRNIVTILTRRSREISLLNNGVGNTNITKRRRQKNE